MLRQGLGLGRRVAAASAARAKAVVPRQPVRRMGAGGKIPNPNEQMDLHVSEIHDIAGKAAMTFCFLWLFYRFEQDGGVLMGLRHPWEHGGGHDDHGHGHGVKFTKADIGEIPEPEEEEH